MRHLIQITVLLSLIVAACGGSSTPAATVEPPLDSSSTLTPSELEPVKRYYAKILTTLRGGRDFNEIAYMTVFPEVAALRDEVSGPESTSIEFIQEILPPLGVELTSFYEVATQELGELQPPQAAAKYHSNLLLMMDAMIYVGNEWQRFGETLDLQALSSARDRISQMGVERTAVETEGIKLAVALLKASQSNPRIEYLVTRYTIELGVASEMDPLLLAQSTFVDLKMEQRASIMRNISSVARSAASRYRAMTPYSDARSLHESTIEIYDRLENVTEQMADMAEQRADVTEEKANLRVAVVSQEVDLIFFSQAQVSVGWTNLLIEALVL